MPGESFQHRESEQLLNQLEEVSHRSGVSRAQAFEDFLEVSVCALAHPTMEESYLETIKPHLAGQVGKRGVDSLAQAFGLLVSLMEKTRADILGDLFQSAISYGERGQFLTPEPICKMMAQMQLPTEATGIEGRRSVLDPCCGSGRMLLASADLQPHWHFVGQDVDQRCVKMTAINLALRNAYGHVVWGNTLTVESKGVLETGRVQMYGNAIRRAHSIPSTRITERVEQTQIDIPEMRSGEQGSDASDDTPGNQLELF